ncbi:MAG: hypothetical protein ABI194_03580 [Gemmatimonadaceae bacterium]
MMRERIARGVAVPVLLLLIAVGCQRSDTSRAESSGTLSDASLRASRRVSGDSIVIRSKDGTMDLGLVHDTVFMGLSDSVLALARADMARDTEETSKFAATVERFVKRKVGAALETRLRYPLSDLDSATYKDGAIRFAYRNRRSMAFEDVAQNGHKSTQSFLPADAQRFVATVNSAIRATRVDAP